jgi:MFS family permease
MAETPSPSPSPYAPGIISEERTPPRPAGRAVVFLLATFLMTLVTNAAFWWGWAMNSSVVSTYGRGLRNWAFSITTATSALILLWAYLSDRIPVWGTRREGYVLVCGLTTSITWLALAFLGHNDIAWVAAVVVVGLASSVSRAAITGALAEIGQRRAATGQLSAASLGLARLALLAGSPLASLFMAAPVAVPAGIAAGLSLALVLAVITLSDDGTRSQDARPAAAVTIPTFLRSRSFWSSATVLALAGFGTVPWETITPLVVNTWRSAEYRSWAWIDYGPSIVAALGYVFICRRVPFRRVLRFALFGQGLALFFFKGSLQTGDHRSVAVAAVVLAICDGLVNVALYDLALRAAPRGREAFGAILVGGLGSFAQTLKSTIERRLDMPVGAAALFAAAATIAAAIAVSLLPRPLIETRDGEHAPA